MASANGKSAITQQWMARRQEIQLTGGTVVIRPYDVTTVLDDEGKALNPLLATVKKHIDGGEQPMQALQKGFMENLEKLPELRKMLNGLLKKVVIEPDLNEFDVDMFTLFEKINIFMALLGGEEALAQAESFREKQSAVLAAVPASE